jgi:hypothetical protein
MQYGNIVIQNRAAGGSGIYFADGTFLTTAATPGSYSNANVASYLSGPVQVGNLTINNATASTSTVTGALVAAGGIGAGGNVNAGGNLHYFGGTIGVGYLPTGWIDSTAVQLKSIGSLGSTVALAALGSDDIMSLVRNMYWDGIDWRHNSTDAASVYQQDATGNHSWGYAPVANAGNIALLQQTMVLTNTGELSVNSASIDNVFVSGTSNSNNTVTGAVVVVGGVGIGGNLNVGSNVVAAGFNYTNGQGPGYTDVLDDISTYFDGVTQVFNLTVSGSTVSPKNPNLLQIWIGGVNVYPAQYVTDVQNLPSVPTFTRGFVIYNSTIIFATAPQPYMDFYGTVRTNNDVMPAFTYKQLQFSAINIMMAY